MPFKMCDEALNLLRFNLTAGVPGVTTWPNGQVYTGNYENDKRHGQGRMEHPDGRTEEGMWENDKFVR